MGRDGSATRERLLDAAQHLFARRGVEAVPIREINDLAGQRNASALHYHFGSRWGLVVAVVDRHQETIDAERRPLLASAGDDPRALVAAVAVPLADRLRTTEGRDYLRILPEIIGPGHDDDELPMPPGLVEALARLDRILGDRPAAVRRVRLRSMALVLTTLLADRAVRLEDGPRPPLGHDAFVGELVAMATGSLLAPAP